MNIRNLFLLVCLLSVTAFSAETNASKRSYIDRLHRSLSNRVLQWSDTLDVKLSRWLGIENNETDATTPAAGAGSVEHRRDKTDAFFQDQRFLKETKETYVRIRFDTIYQTRENDSFNLEMDAHLPLNRSQKRFNFFIENLTNKNAGKTLENVSSKSAAPSLGINYFAPEAYGITSKYSIGVHGINLYARARYSKDFKAGRWVIEPAQTLEYSLKYRFEERTDLYFDRALSKAQLFRLQLYRKTQTDVDGMDYAAVLSYFYTSTRATGWRISETFWGNTEYRYREKEGSLSEKFGGISNYRTEVSWRRNVWRKWFFYELIPSVNFRRDYGYRANYAFRLFIDIYFGTYRW